MDREEAREEQLKKENRELRWKAREGERLVEELEVELERESRTGKKLRTRLIVLDGEYMRDQEELEESHLRLRRLEDEQVGRRRQLTALVKETDTLTMEVLRKEQEMRRLLHRKEELWKALAVQELLGRRQEVKLGQKGAVIELLLHTVGGQERRILGLEERKPEERGAKKEIVRIRQETMVPRQSARWAQGETRGDREETRGAKAKEKKGGAKDWDKETFIQKENQLKQKKEVTLQYSEDVLVKKTHALEKFGENKAKMLNANMYTVSAICKREGIIVILCEIASLILTQDLRDQSV